MKRNIANEFNNRTLSTRKFICLLWKESTKLCSEPPKFNFFPYSFALGAFLGLVLLGAFSDGVIDNEVVEALEEQEEVPVILMLNY